MLEQLLSYLHNWFRVRDDVDGKYPDEYTVEGGSIELPFLQNGQYFRIMGSVFNDGLYIYGEGILDGDGKETELTDETFDGCIWSLAIPKAVLSLEKDIAEWEKKYGDAVASPYTSESFGGYSYSKSASSADGSAGWQGAFKSQLNRWRKISED